MRIVTGYKGEPHITSNAVQAFNQGIFGTENYVLNVGSKFAAAITDANTITISDGEGILQGVHFRIDPGTTETVNISNGTTGYKRIDYICARYTKNALTGVESVDLVVVEGTPAASTPTVPTINTGDVLTGSSPVDFPLYEVNLDGLTPSISAIYNSSGLFAPDITTATVIEQFRHFEGDITINESGWYALFSSTNGLVSFSMYQDYYQQINPVAAGMSMTPWVYLKKGVSGLKYESEGSTTFLMRAKSI